MNKNLTGAWRRLASRILLAGIVGLLAFSTSVVTSPQQTVFAKKCTLVELRPGYPGYPGYQGFVTGAQGIGDHECLEDLEEDFPRLSQRTQDRENQQAARSLGIGGSANLWTWENWLAIEGARGLVSTCYVCALFYDGNRTQPQNTDVERDDPRLVSGTFGDTWLMTYARDQAGAPSWLPPVDDYAFRALVTLIYGEPYLNAEQLMEAYELYGEQWITESMKPGGSSIDTDWLWHRMLDRGGYFAMPKAASIDDQVFAVTLGFYGIWAVGTFPDEKSPALQACLNKKW